MGGAIRGGDSPRVIAQEGGNASPSTFKEQEKGFTNKAGAPAQRVEGAKGYEGNKGKHSSD